MDKYKIIDHINVSPTLLLIQVLDEEELIKCRIRLNKADFNNDKDAVDYATKIRNALIEYDKQVVKGDQNES